MRKEMTMRVLADHGIIQQGTEIEVVPEALPGDAPNRNPSLWRARIANPRGLKESIIWAFDNHPYSPTELLRKLRREHGVHWWKGRRTFTQWRIIGRSESMWDQAERLPR